jgi:site-specific DNA recombinase
MNAKPNSSDNINLLKPFAVKSKKTLIIFGDRAVTWNRCSSKKQDSIGWQEKVTGEFVKQNNWNLIKAFGVKESAKTDDRKEFQDMLKFCRKENISHIVFFSYDRFSRAGDTTILDKLRKQGIKVHAATQGADDETPSGRMTQKMYLMFAEMENEQRREKIVEGLRNKLRKGEWITAPPIGYEKRYTTGRKEHDHDKPQCYINDTGQLLRQAFHWKERENITNLAIIDRLKNMGLSLTPDHLTRIFRNPFYCGYITSTLLDEGEIIRGNHEALVCEDIFLRVNGLVNGNPHGWKQCNDNVNMTMKATVHCSKCGRLFTAYTNKGKYVYYKCPNLGCKVNISGAKLTNLFAKELSKYSLSAPVLPFVMNQLEATYAILKSSEVVRVKPMKDELTRLQKELEAMEMNLAIGNLPLDLFCKHSASHKEKISSIENELSKLTQDCSNMNLYLESSLNLACNLLNTWNLLDYPGRVRLQKLVFPDGLVYGPDKHVVRTSVVNPIFSAISSISNTLSKETFVVKTAKSEELPQLYLMFPSSNFFWECLEEVSTQMNDFEANYYNLRIGNEFKPQNLSYSGTASFNFETVNSTAMPELKTLSQDFYRKGDMTGQTINRIYI